jgi:hypothetical protein
VHSLQGIIVLIILFKIQGFLLAGDPLGGIVCKFAALFVDAAHTLFGAQHGQFIQLRTSGAVFAPPLNFLSEEFDHSHSSDLSAIIHQQDRNFYCYFLIFARKWGIQPEYLQKWPEAPDVGCIVAAKEGKIEMPWRSCRKWRSGSAFREGNTSWKDPGLRMRSAYKRRSPQS